ncbi:hypothetical protein N185_00020 [Sinorhizobium sp. GW3]|nr:hypothetical protein N185_00020 [Sinorhizobium sp. GW3]
MTENAHRQMKASEIPAFVVDVIEDGCNICAVGSERLPPTSGRSADT